MPERSRGESALGCFTLYLVPSINVEFPTAKAALAASILVSQGILEERQDSSEDKALNGHASYGVGDKGELAFVAETIEDDVPFETCFIFGSDRPDIVPQAAGVDPKCPKCAAKVFDAYIDFVNAEKVEEAFQCSECGHEGRIDGLVDETGIFVTNFYIAFDDTNGSKLRSEWIESISRQLGIALVVKEYKLARRHCGSVRA